MKIDDLQGKLVAVLGFGQEGRAVTQYLLRHGIKPVLFDQRPWQEWPAEDQRRIQALGLNFIFGPDAFLELKGFDVAFRSPGIKISQLTTDNLQLTSQAKWFFDHCPAKIIGVTGTKGKGTTASLIFEILNRQATSYKLPSKTYLTGNIGTTQPLKILEELKADDWVIYELSSFQLQDLRKSPHIGVVLMVTSEHLDYHQNQEEYLAAKAAITKFQLESDFAIINADFPNSAAIGKQGQGQKLYFSTQNPANCWVHNGEFSLKANTSAAVEVFIKTQELQLRGEHNWQNVCAAALAAAIAGADIKSIHDAVAEFRGLEHRLEFAAEKRGVKFYNDSFSTTPETAIAAIESFFEPEIVILGGSSKNSDFTQLGRIIARKANIKALILIGEEAPKINQAIINAGGTKARLFTGASSTPEIFEQVKSVAEAGDVVLLSPACASFDMYENYKDRGLQFKEQIQTF
ncbi:MAG: UDP-N-acetylmuramoyl-L-alanine--D-glutamate ligase [Patescibacteria group bacterium]|nr:UDP-N-acetylmuramoyl-L-alanine--D-glutamate ligase [Patescibacteria group bacterium]